MIGFLRNVKEKSVDSCQSSNLITLSSLCTAPEKFRHSYSFVVLDTAQTTIFTNGPFIRSDSGSGVKEIVRVVFSFDLAQGCVVVAVEILLEVGLTEVGLVQIRP